MPSLLLLTVVTFGLLELAPQGGLGELAAVLDPDPLTGDHALRMERVARLREQLEMDGASFWSRYFAWVRRVVCVEFGADAAASSALLARLGKALPVTLLLNLTAGLSAIALGTWLGLRWGLLDRNRPLPMQAILLAVAALPELILVSLCLAVFSGPLLGWLPISGLGSAQGEVVGRWAALFDFGRHLMLPVVVLAVGPTAVVARHVRSTARSVRHSAFVDALVASGVGGRTVRQRILRNSFGVQLTLLGELAAGLVVGSVVVESGFGLPGLGAVAIEAIRERDVAMILTLTVLTGAVATFALALSDIVRAIVDPRVRWEHP